MVLMLWDHCLTFGEEVATMWGPLNERILTKVVHILNRYFTEAVLIYRLYATSELGRSPDSNTCKAVVWLANESAIIVATISQFYIMMRVYRLWDHRQSVRKTLLVAFGICITALTILSTLSVLSYLKTGAESQNICDIERIPPTVPCSVGVLLLFDVFVIVITIYNSLEKPRRSESELLDSLMCDGARNYLAVCILWLLILVSSVTINAAVFFSLFTLVCSLNANIAARVHLRVEGLRLIVPTRSITIYRGSAEIWHS